jgi:hypothetical protein
MQTALFIAAISICLVIVWETLVPGHYKEGFSQPKVDPLWAQFVPTRTDINANIEDGAYDRDKRYFNDYVDIQRLGLSRDYCRMIVPKGGAEDEAFFACALAGTEGLSSTSYRTKTLRDGFLRSRDDYMRDVYREGRSSYCSILKVGPDTFQARCYRAGDKKFYDVDHQDADPPPEQAALLRFYEGIMIWYRFADDMIDYSYSTFSTYAGKMDMPAVDKPMKGLTFNGVDQFVRIGENADLRFGNKTPLRFMRAVSMWVYFDEFTNNAHIFDFGNGAGEDNVFLGIFGRGNMGAQTNEIRDSILCRDSSTLTVPEAPSGAQRVPEMTSQELMKTTGANVNDYESKGFATFGRRMGALQPMAAPASQETADLLYEVWDGKQRILRVKLPNAVRRQRWTHVAITAKNMDAFQPALQFFIDGELIYTKDSGVLPRRNATSKNYIGKSNWAEITSQYENNDELFKGSLFDFRVYKMPMPARKVRDTYEWGRQKLGIAAGPRAGALSNLLIASTPTSATQEAIEEQDRKAEAKAAKASAAAAAAAAKTK